MGGGKYTISCVTCHILRVVYHLTPVTNTNSHSHRLSPANSHIMRNGLVYKNPLNKKTFLNAKKSLKRQKLKNIYRYANSM